MDWMKVFRTAEMSGATSSVWLWLILVFVIFIKSSSAGQEIITAKSGQDNITLLCRAPNDKTTLVEWRRTDLGKEYVLLYRDGHLYPDNQHPSFKKRVDLQDRQMKDGDVSLILKHVTIDDNGTYECRVFMEDTRSWKISIINLSVVVPPVKKNITAGENVILPCQAPNTNSNPNTVVVWSRADLKPKYVLLYRNKQFDPDDQHPSFKDRVDLQDRQIKDGDVSLILKDVTIADSGTYECCVFMKDTRSWKSINTTYLRVDPPGQPIGLKIILLMVTAVLLVPITGGILIYRRYKKQHQDPKKPGDSHRTCLLP